jgi:molybdopterin-biosynthesis enzyme MoeA-like protein
MTTSTLLTPHPETHPRFGLIVIGDEILSGKRADKHLAHIVGLLGARGLQLDYAHYVGDDPARITQTLKDGFAAGDAIFSTGGIGATPDDHTRQCAARALGVELVLHPTAKTLILERMQEVARERGEPYLPERDDNVHRLQMGMFPQGAQIIPNPYNKIPGFSCAGTGAGHIHFVPGFPVMAWPMVAWVLDKQYAAWFKPGAWVEQSVIVMGAMEATLTPLMESIEREYAVKVFSLPSVDHPDYGRHIELGVKGAPAVVESAFVALRAGLGAFALQLGPELVRK